MELKCENDEQMNPVNGLEKTIEMRFKIRCYSKFTASLTGNTPTFNEIVENGKQIRNRNDQVSKRITNKPLQVVYAAVGQCCRQTYHCQIKQIKRSGVVTFFFFSVDTITETKQ